MRRKIPAKMLLKLIARTPDIIPKGLSYLYRKKMAQTGTLNVETE